MSEIEFMRWLTSIGVYYECLAYHNTCDPIRGIWNYEDDCNKRCMRIYNMNFDEVYKVIVDKTFGERVDQYRKEISKIFEV